ncbi:MAG: peptidylprolyl isomerase [Campylobacter sp.]|nr:peptidylprolyl isomerase [Campylobacter sp.]MBR7048169.1 peptidylprolyl isomerase [Campylobacter sp.]
MAQNRVIKMYYELKDAKNGEILESNFNANPIAFLSGKNQILQKLEDEVLNLGEGESKIIKILPQDGVGEYDENAVQTLPKEQFAGIDLQIGMELFGEGEDGSVARVIVKEITDESVSVDFNHPYAGKELEFNIKIVENREATEDEILMGTPEGEHSCCCGGGGHDEGGCCGGGHHHDDHECCGGHGHGEDGGCCGKHNH